MNFQRPRRSSRRYAGDRAIGTEAVTNLSSMKQRRSADGTYLRRRYATIAVGLVVVIGVIIFAVTSTKAKDELPVSVAEITEKVISEITHSHTDSYELLTSQSNSDANSTIGVNSTLAVYEHKKSGIDIVTMIPIDPYQDATFGINFRTPSERDDGAQYVVKNAVLAGSENYPVKDPLNQMKRGSLQTYSDSWIERDRTSFVMASRNLADFRNNLKVTVDAVFNPLFIKDEHKWIYRQEGWRLESPDNVNLLISGNAYVEAKAAQMNPEEVMIKHIYSNLFPGHVYGKNPKGEASEVVTMTYQEVIAYYETYYHPSNAQAFCYGSQEFIDVCLNELDVQLSEYENNTSVGNHSQIPWQELTEVEEQIKNITYPDYQEQVDYRSVIAWILNDEPMDLRTQIAWQLIYELLAGSNTALVPKIIFDSNLGTDIVTHFQHSLQQWVLALGVSGIESYEDVATADRKIMQELAKVVSKGFDSDAMEAAMHKMEFKFREQSPDDVPLGVKYFRDILRNWNYGQAPLEPLNSATEFLNLKAEIQNEGQEFLLTLMTQRMMDNKHTVSLSLHPDTNYAIQYERLEQNWLDNLDTYLNKEEGLKVMSETQKFKEMQENGDSEEELAKIPRLEVSELNQTMYIPPSDLIKNLYETDVTAIKHKLPFTNGIAYVDFSIDMSNMDFDDVVLIPLFCQLLLEGGTQAHDDVEMQRQIDKYTGGVTITPIIEEIVQTDDHDYYLVPDGKHFVTKLIISGSCIASDTCLPMLILFRQFVWDSNVRNKEKAIEILEARINEMEQDVQINGHKYTTSRVESRYSLSGFVREQWYGITQLMQMRRALAQIKDNFTELGLRLVKMQDELKRGHHNGMHMSITGDHEALTDIKGPLSNFMKNGLPLATQKTPFPNFAEEEHPWVPKGMHRVKEEFSSETSNQAFTVPTRVNHVAKGGILYDVGERIPGADMVVTQYLGGYYLFNELRFGQGAQEAWSFLDLDSGVCIYQSDRDPGIFSTLETYEHGATWLWEQVHNGELPLEAKSAIVGAIGRMDAKIMTEPKKLGRQALISHLKEDRHEFRQHWRNQILNANADDFMAMVERLGSWGHPSVCVVTSPEVYDTIDQEDFAISKCDYSGYQC